MRKYNTEKNKTNIGMYLLISLLIIVGYFINIVDSKAIEPQDELVPVISYFDESSLTIYMSDNHNITIDLEAGETIEDYVIIYYIGENRFISFTEKFFDYLINSKDERLYKYYYYLNDTSYLIN
jgi:hypothetical protein